MATHYSVPAWRIPGMGEPGGRPSMGFAQSRTRLKRFSSSIVNLQCCVSFKCIASDLLIHMFISYYIHIYSFPIIIKY